MIDIQLCSLVDVNSKVQWFSLANLHYNFITKSIPKKIMFKRLFSTSQIDKAMSECHIDKTHEMMTTKKLTDLAVRYFTSIQSHDKKNVNINININNNINNQINININHCEKEEKTTRVFNSRKDEFIKAVLKKIRSNCEIQRIKGLILAHSIIKKTYDGEFMEVMEEEMDKYIVEGFTPEEKQLSARTQHDEKIQVKLQNSQQEFIQRHIISFYCQYLKKFIINIETYRYAQKYVSGPRPEYPNFIDLINHGFIILNLMNYILQSQFTFNKMGRYYIDHNEVLNLFMMYLNDMIIYNSYIKEVSKSSVKNIKYSDGEEMKHHFLFITESQKSSDRLYEFFYNRYYYAKVKKLIMMPTFLTIHNEQYRDLVQHVKKNDKELLFLVKNSKYEQGDRGRSRSKTIGTEVSDRSQKLNKTEIGEKHPKQYHSIMNYFEDASSPQKNPKETSFSQASSIRKARSSFKPK